MPLDPEPALPLDAQADDWDICDGGLFRYFVGTEHRCGIPVVIAGCSGILATIDMRIFAAD